MALFGFGKPRPPDDARRRVEAWAREVAGLPPGTVLKINEIVCADPACPGTETVILIMEPGRRTYARKIAKRLSEISEAEVRDALQSQA